jgi:hypothetical protein
MKFSRFSAPAAKRSYAWFVSARHGEQHFATNNHRSDGPLTIGPPLRSHRNARPPPLLNGMDRIFLFIIASSLLALATAFALIFISGSGRHA